jgi:hypothetical protein
MALGPLPRLFLRASQSRGPSSGTVRSSGESQAQQEQTPEISRSDSEDEVFRAHPRQLQDPDVAGGLRPELDPAEIREADTAGPGPSSLGNSGASFCRCACQIWSCSASSAFETRSSLVGQCPPPWAFLTLSPPDLYGFDYHCPRVIGVSSTLDPPRTHFREWVPCKQMVPKHDPGILFLSVHCASLNEKFRQRKALIATFLSVWSQRRLDTPTWPATFKKSQGQAAQSLLVVL